MRAYKFLDASFALKSLLERRLKQSRIRDLNDPFELASYDLRDPGIRKAFFHTRKNIHEARGVLCFSSKWSDPVVWAHYSDKHRGLCLGFEVPKITGDPEKDECDRVSYVKTPRKFPNNFADLPEAKRFAIAHKILFTKFTHWAYESEIRFWAPLQNKDDELNYMDFNKKLRLVEVIVGAKCSLKKSTIMRVLGDLSGSVTVIKATAAYHRFQMVKGQSWHSQVS